MLLEYIAGDKDLFYPPFVGYTNIEVLRLALEDWKLRDDLAASAFLRGSYKYPPLHIAARIGNIEMIQCLLEKGANGEQRDRYQLSQDMTI